jgi:hypothetical protein
MWIINQIKQVILIRKLINRLMEQRKAILLIQFPTRQRPEKFLMVAKKYIDMLADKENYIMNVSCDCDDFTMNNKKMIDAVYNLGAEGKIVLNFNENKSKIEAVNADIGTFDFDICLLASDDMIPKEPNYDQTIREYYQRFFPNYDGVLHFNDGHQRDQLNTLSILGVTYYKRFGYIYHPAYKSLWADAEFDNVSRRLGKRKYFDQVIIKHEHPNFGYVPNDQLYMKNDSFEGVDKRTYFDRVAQNYGLPQH